MELGLGTHNIRMMRLIPSSKSRGRNTISGLITRPAPLFKIGAHSLEVLILAIADSKGRFNAVKGLSLEVIYSDT